MKHILLKSADLLAARAYFAQRVQNKTRAAREWFLNMERQPLGSITHISMNALIETACWSLFVCQWGSIAFSALIGRE